MLPPDFASQIAARRPVSMLFVLDGSDSQMANTVLGYARQIVASQTGVVYEIDVRPPYEAAPLVWYNPDLKSSIFLVPGLLAFILMVSSVIATALAVVREKERGTMESLRATPIRAIELLLGKTLPYLLVASVSAAGSLFLAWALFDVPIRGSLFWLAAVTLLFLAGGLGWGTFISTLADNQQLAFQLGLLSSMLPTLLLSGFIFPISSMPRASADHLPHRPGPLLHRRAARDRAQGRRPRGVVAAGRRPHHLREHRAGPRNRPHDPEPVMRLLMNMLIKELLQLRRDPKILSVLFIAPIVQLTILGYAATTDVRRVELAICDLDRTAASRGLVEDFTASTYFRLVAAVDTQDALD